MGNLRLIEDDIIEWLLSGKAVIVQDGCLNDQIIGYTVEQDSYRTCYGERKKRVVTFITTACKFPERINFDEEITYENVEYFGNSMFINM